jgi:DNA-binding transcriptional MerR regulator
MKIKQVSKLTGLTEKTIRYYESKDLVKPDIRYLNGRYFREYDKEQILALKAVATLRRAKFTVEQISIMQLFPEQIHDVVDSYLKSLKQELVRLNALINAEDIGQAVSIYDLASRLEGAAKDMQLPTIDLKFNFKRFDRESASIKGRINSKPLLAYRFGWFSLYSGHDFNRYQDMKSKLDAAGIAFKATEYTATSRLSIQGLENQGSSFMNSKGPTVMPMGFQAKALSNKSLDMYYIDVRKKDSEKAREALRSVI